MKYMIFMNRCISTNSIILILLTGLLTHGCGLSEEEKGRSDSQYRVSDFMSGRDTALFKRADKPRPIQFPRDLGAHPAYKTEWWYYTGNLSADNGRRFGYELTIFRSGLRPDALKIGNPSAWRTKHLYMAHLAITDAAGEEFYSYERYARGAAGLAGAQSDPFKVWLENWQVRRGSESSLSSGKKIPDMLLQAQAEPISLDLRLQSVKPPVLQGDRGLDQKGPESGNASYYFSLTRLESKGTLSIGKKSFEVTGWSWMDREWSTSALGKDQVGWDWFALQLSDNREIMYYRLCNKDGSASAYSNGVIIDSTGQKISIAPDDISIAPQAYWTSPTTGVRYPVRWQMNIPEQNIKLEIIPLLENQELQTRFKYWEGAVSIIGKYKNETLDGYGYVELTGYDDEVNRGSSKR